jgi:tRNA dimethylallyltransferase
MQLVITSMTITTKKGPTKRTTNASRKVVVIVGPTASGKTALAVELSRTHDGEVISADSRQVYTGLNIGTGKVTRSEMKGVRHHLLDVANPRSVFSADMFVQKASTAIEQIYSRKHLPILAGGTGFYIDALMGRVALGAAPANPKLRSTLATHATAALWKLLQQKDPRRYADIVQKGELNNRVRLIRAIEIASAPAHTPAPTQTNTQRYNVLYIGVTHPRDVLRKRINIRLAARIKRGMFLEMKRLHTKGLSWKRMRELGLEYRYGAEYLTGSLKRDEVETILQQKIWQYARRQATYWKRNTEIHWFHPSETKKISALVKNFLEN